MYNELFISVTCIVYKHINLCVIFYDKLTVLATLHILTSDTIEIPSGVSPQLEQSLRKLNVTLNIIRDVNAEFCRTYYPSDIATSQNIQKEIFNGVMNVIAELKNNDMMAVNIVKNCSY